MKIEIPKEYINHFAGATVYVAYCRKSSMFLMNKDQKENFKKTLKEAWGNYGDRCEKGISVQVDKLDIENGTIEIPSKTPLKGEDRVFIRQKAGIVLS